MVKRMQIALNSRERQPGPLPRRSRSPVLRGVALLAAVVAPAVWLAAVARRLALTLLTGGPASPPDLLTALAAVAALGLLFWLLVAVLAEMLAALPGRTGAGGTWLARRVSPALVRRGVTLALGAGLAGVMTAPLAAAAAPPDPGFGAVLAPAPSGSDPSAGAVPRAPASVPDAPASVPVPGWVPAPPTVRPAPGTELLARAPRPAPVDDAVVVHRGDTLWSIAARHLAPGASDAEIAAAWPRWYAANRAVIGPDPQLILPGQRLRPPGGGDRR